MDLETYTDAVLDELDRLNASHATNLPTTVQTIGHAFMKGRNPIAVAVAIAGKVSQPAA